MKPIRIAIIGFGKIAADQHLPSIEANPRFELAATSSRSGQGPQPAFTDWRELLRSVQGLEAVAITTPPGPRYEIARECVKAGLHCLLEKPPTATLAEIDDLAGLAETQQVSLYTTWHARHHAAVDAAAKALAGKRIASFEILWHEDVHKWHPGQQWIWEPGGFGVFDPGINAFSIATRIFPGPLFVRQADAQRAVQRPDTDRRRHPVRKSAGRRAAPRQSRLAPERRRGVDDHRAHHGRHRGPADRRGRRPVDRRQACRDVGDRRISRHLSRSSSTSSTSGEAKSTSRRCDWSRTACCSGASPRSIRSRCDGP